MNRIDLQQPADERILDAEALLQAGRFSAAYYLCGYAIEFALKARISKQVGLHDFPDRGLAQRSFSHDLVDLVELARLKLPLQLDSTPAPNALSINWSIVKNWNERTRYEPKTEYEARRLFQAVTDNSSGVFPWIKTRW